jgi:hypothetical protein
MEKWSHCTVKKTSLPRSATESDASSARPDFFNYRQPPPTGPRGKYRLARTETIATMRNGDPMFNSGKNKHRSCRLAVFLAVDVDARSFIIQHFS